MDYNKNLILEEWRDIEGFKHYEISNYGRVKSFSAKSKGNLIKLKQEKVGYLRIGLIKNKSQRKYFRISRLVALAFIPNPDNLPIADHIDRNRFNNFVGNLRWATSANNNANVGLSSTNTSGYKGVHWCNTKNKFIASIRIDKKKMNIGRFDTAEEASLAYEAKAKELRGDFHYNPNYN